MRHASAPLHRRLAREMRKSYQLYLIFLPALLYVLVYEYYPMYGVQIAFRNYVPARGIWDSKWVGFSHFTRFFNSYYFTITLKNTLTLSLLNLALGFPLPILLAILITELNSRPFRKSLQLISYAPHFISSVAVVGIIQVMFASQGLVNGVLGRLGLGSVQYLSSPKAFVWLYVLSGVWQNAGWNSVIYFSTLAGVDPQMYEAAYIDGANKVQRIWYIDLPSILPTMIILLILRSGQIMSVGYEKVYLMQNALNASTSEIISTYVYKMGLQKAQYSFSSAVGLFNSAINLVLLLSVNMISRRVNQTSLW